MMSFVVGDGVCVCLWRFEAESMEVRLGRVIVLLRVSIEIVMGVVLVVVCFWYD